jgi:hypothetical protein
VLFQRGERMDKAYAIGAGLAHADNAARTDVDPGLAHHAQGIEPVLERAGGDHLVIAFGRGVDVVVVVIQARLGELRGLLGVSMPSVMQVSMPISRTPFTICTMAPMSRSLGLRQAAPMQNRLARIARLRGRLQHGLHVHQLARRHAAVGLHALRAIAAVFRAAAGLDRQQRAQLHFAGAVMVAVHRRRGIPVR